MRQRFKNTNDKTLKELGVSRGPERGVKSPIGGPIGALVIAVAFACASVFLGTSLVHANPRGASDVPRTIARRAIGRRVFLAGGVAAGVLGINAHAHARPRGANRLASAGAEGVSAQFLGAVREGRRSTYEVRDAREQLQDRWSEEVVRVDRLGGGRWRALVRHTLSSGAVVHSILKGDERGISPSRSETTLDDRAHHVRTYGVALPKDPQLGERWQQISSWFVTPRTHHRLEISSEVRARSDGPDSRLEVRSIQRHIVRDGERPPSIAESEVVESYDANGLVRRISSDGNVTSRTSFEPGGGSR